MDSLQNPGLDLYGQIDPNPPRRRLSNQHFCKEAPKQAEISEMKAPEHKNVYIMAAYSTTEKANPAKAGDAKPMGLPPRKRPRSPGRRK